MIAEESSQHGRADAIFTETTNLLWQLHDHAGRRRWTSMAVDLLLAISELHCGPWHHLGTAPGTLRLPFTAACSYVDELLDELQLFSYGLAARAALNATREVLDGNRPHKTSDRRF